MGRYTWIVIGSLVITAVLAVMQWRSEIGARREPAAQGGAPSAGQNSVAASSGSMVASPKGPVTYPSKTSSVSEVADPQFRQWIVSEAKNLDAPRVNAERKRAEIKGVIDRLTPAQSRQLLVTARDPSSPASEKILSTYLLVEGGSLSRGELTALIASPVPDHGPHQAHSAAEAVGVREKSLRIMAIDGLFSRAQNDPSAREALAKVIDDIQDPYIKEYARNRYARFKNQ